MSYKERYDEWLNGSFTDEETKRELAEITDEKEIEDRFYCGLTFGTAGLRGMIGAGTNRMNKYTVMKATQGLANYINKKGIANPSVAISYDSRKYSYEFSNYAALVLNANGIKTYLSDVLRPTPVLSYMVREYKCTAGIMMTASHNPKEYNGYKVYWDDGCQIKEPVDKEIIDEVNSIEDYTSIKMMDIEEAKEKGLYNLVGNEIDDKFIERIKKESINSDLCEKCGDKINIVYTPLNGTGNVLVRRVLKEMGFTNVHVVEEQEKPDENFTTVPKPNPEYIEVYDLAIKKAKETNADVIIATDPDADRLGLMVKDEKNDYHLFTGNMIGSMLCEYILNSLKENNKLPQNGFVVKSIVTSNLVKKMCESYGVELVNTLTGFKYIGEAIDKRKDDGTYLFGFEESMGYLRGTHVRDKDAVVSAMLLAEVMAYCKEKNITMFEYMNSIYKKYGFYIDSVTSKRFEGINGKKEMEEIMLDYKSNVKPEIAGYKVTSFIDHSKQLVKDLINDSANKTGLPKANVVFYDLEDGSFICVRPSGTEPVVKYYFNVIGSDEEEAKNKLEKFKKEYL